MADKIFITGASSGIGEHLAYHYARQGATLGLAARRKEVLETIAAECRKLGAETHVFSLDVGNQEECKTAANAFIELAGGVDMVIANAAISFDDYLEKGDSTKINQLLTTNILGVTNIVYPFSPVLINQKAGKIVIISSIAGVRGLPRRGGYSSSKAALRLLANAWRFTMSKYNVHVSTIYPGFIRTPLTAKRKTIMPFLMDVEPAVAKITWAIAKGKKNYLFPWPWRILFPIIRAVPDWIVGKVV